MQIEQVESAAVGSIQAGYAFTALKNQQFPNFHTKDQTDRFFRWYLHPPFLFCLKLITRMFACRGIKLNQDLHIAKFRFNMQFRLVNAEEFIKQLLSSPEVQQAFKPLESLGTVAKVTFKQINCTVLNMAYFDVFEEIGIVAGNSGSIQGCMDEWVDGMQLSDKLRQALACEEDENYELFQ